MLLVAGTNVKRYIGMKTMISGRNEELSLLFAEKTCDSTKQVENHRFENNAVELSYTY